jgi:hypothetical protein
MKTLTVTLVAVAFASVGVAQQAPLTTYFGEAKITVNSGPNADGFMRVRVVPQNGTPRETTLAVPKSMGENELASGITEALNKVLGPEYSADKDGGEHVKIRKESREAADFSVEITFNSPGFSIILEED